MLFSDSCIVNELPVLPAARLDGSLTAMDPPSPDDDLVSLFYFLKGRAVYIPPDGQWWGLTWRTNSSSTVAAESKSPADRGGTEAAEPGRSFSAQQPSSHQGWGKNPEESSEKNPQQAVGSGQPAEEEGVHRRTGEQVGVLTEIWRSGL